MRPTPFTGYETQARDVGHYFHGIRDTKARDTRHHCHGIRDTLTGYEAPIPRDTGHAIHGIRDTVLTGYEAQEKLLKWLVTLIQPAFQDSEKII
jgi:hypothetical protein